MTKDRVVYFLRLSVSVGIIVGLFFLIDVDDFPSLAEIKIPYVLGCLTVAFVLRFLNAYKWSFLVRAASVEVRFPDLLKIYFSSGFVGLVLPSSVGGEVLKGYGLAKNTAETVDSASSVVVDRVTGLLALTVVCLLGYHISPPELQANSVIALIETVSLIILMGAAIVSLVGISTRGSYLAPDGADGRAVSFVKKVGRSFYQYRSAGSALALAMVMSLAVQILRVGMVLLAGLAVSVYPDIWHFLIFVPFVQLGSLVPLTMSGIGVQEGAAVYLFSLVGVGTAATLSMYLLVRLMIIISVSPGAWVYFREGLAARSEAELSGATGG